jgi:hypothetical protein
VNSSTFRVQSSHRFQPTNMTLHRGPIWRSRSVLGDCGSE